MGDWCFIGVDERLEVTGSTRQMLMPGATLDLCDIECDTNLVMVTVDLETSKIGKGCDRDIYSLQAHRKICGKTTIYLFRFFLQLD